MQEPTPAPFAWEHRVYALPPEVGGWSIEVWNPMTKTWQRGHWEPRWPANEEAAAREWADAANAEQRKRNAGEA